MTERKCPFVPRRNPVSCPECGSQEVNVEPGGPGLGSIFHCDDCGYHGPSEVPDPVVDKKSSSWNPGAILKNLGLLGEEEDDSSDS